MGPTAARAIARLLEHHSSRSGGSRLEAARRLVVGRATVERRSYSSPDEMPDDPRVALRLGEAYAGKILVSKAMLGARVAGPAARGDADADPPWRHKLGEMEARLDFVPGPEDVARTAEKGEALMRSLLARDDLSAAQRAGAKALLDRFRSARQPIENPAGEPAP